MRLPVGEPAYGRSWPDAVNARVASTGITRLQISRVGPGRVNPPRLWCRAG